MLGGALEALSESFASVVLDDQECFKTKDGWEKLLELLPVEAEDVRKALRRKWEDEDEDERPTSSAEKWDDLKTEIKAHELEHGRNVRSSLTPFFPI